MDSVHVHSIAIVVHLIWGSDVIACPRHLALCMWHRTCSINGPSRVPQIVGNHFSACPRSNNTQQFQKCSQQAQKMHFSEMMIILMVMIIMTKQSTCIDPEPIISTVQNLPHLMLTIVKWVVTGGEVK